MFPIKRCFFGNNPFISCYRKTSKLEVTDEAKAVNWLKRHKFTDAIKVVAPTVYKTEVRRLLSAGQKVPGCMVVDDRSCSLK